MRENAADAPVRGASSAQAPARCSSAIDAGVMVLTRRSGCGGSSSDVGGG
jgi:hypothetical protein